jgi:hypothetical protein
MWDPNIEQTYTVEYKVQTETKNEQWHLLLQEVNSKELEATFYMILKFFEMTSDTLDRAMMKEDKIVFGFVHFIVPYLLHTRAVEPQKQPLLSSTRTEQENNGVMQPVSRQRLLKHFPTRTMETVSQWMNDIACC